MAIVVDEAVSGAARQRRQRGQSAAIVVHRIRVPRSGEVVTVDWTPAIGKESDYQVQDTGDVTVLVEKRIARYLHWHDLTISLGRLGGRAFPVIAEEPAITLKLAQWERSHPAPASSSWSARPQSQYSPYR